MIRIEALPCKDLELCVYSGVMKTQAHWKQKAFLSGFLDGFGGIGQFSSPMTPARKPVSIRLSSGIEMTPLEMMRTRAARLRSQTKAQAAR